MASSSETSGSSHEYPQAPTETDHPDASPNWADDGSRGHHWIGRFDDLLLRLDAWRRQPGIVLLAGLSVVGLLVGGWWLGRPPSPSFAETDIPIARLEPTSAPAAPPASLLVHVVGAVHQPGVYTLQTGDRVQDAIAAAGGPVVNADIQQLNMAAELSDGTQLRVPLEGEVVAPIGSPSGDGGAGIVHLNRASEAELQTLPGVGPATAAAIVGWRDEHGPFSTVEELLAVPGIGPAKLAGLADQVVAP